jgi:hypothetical protein
MYSNDTENTSLPAKRRNWRLWLFIVLVVLPILFFSIYTWLTLQFVYARGERTGFVQKISKKGWIFKTWEGELAMVNLPGTVPEIFHFSVRKDNIAEKVQQSLGQRVVLHYEQHRAVPVNWFAETEHFINDVTPVTDALQIPPK